MALHNNYIFMQKKHAIIVLVAIALIVIGIFFLPKSVGSTKLNGFAQCIKDKGAVFYGAYWCPHCQAQKALFEASASLLPYVECSNPDRTQTQVCNDKNVEQYPTWDFASGERIVGEASLETLAEKTGCELPQ